MSSIFGKRGNSFAHDLTRRGYHVAYRENEVNHCPGCGRSHWYVGRLSAECGFCGTALPLMDTGTIGAGLFRPRTRTWDDFATAA
jgi:ribosomal protein L37AE/L43A